MTFSNLKESDEQKLLESKENAADIHEKEPAKVSTHAYLKFVLKKAVFYVIAFFIAVSLTYVLPRLLPDPIERLLPTCQSCPTDPNWLARRASLEAYFGIDRPVWESLLNFWANFFKLDFGPSLLYYPRPAAEIVAAALPYTLMIVIPALIISFIVGNWMGTKIGFSKNWKNTLGYYLLIGLQSVPFYWMALVFLDGGVRIGMFDLSPRPGFTWETSFTLLRYAVLPFFALLVCTTGGWATGMRAMTIYEMNSGYILYCEKLGFRKYKLQNIVQRNAILPQFTGLNLRLSEFIGATLVLEQVLYWPGIGNLMINAFTANDYPLIMATFFITILIVLIGNFMIDIAYGFLDPRIKTGSEGG